MRITKQPNAFLKRVWTTVLLMGELSPLNLRRQNNCLLSSFSQSQESRHSIAVNFTNLSQLWGPASWSQRLPRVDKNAGCSSGLKRIRQEADTQILTPGKGRSECRRRNVR